MVDLPNSWTRLTGSMEIYSRDMIQSGGERRFGVDGSGSASAGWFHPQHGARWRPRRLATESGGSGPGAYECQDETILRIHGGHFVRLPCSLEIGRAHV